MSVTLVELCAGTAAVSRAALGHRHGSKAADLCGYMGSKRRWASELARALTDDVVPDQVVLVDAGPWGDFWATMVQPGAVAAVAHHLDEWADETPSLVALWPVLAEQPPSEAPARRAAQFLCLQARTPSCVPVWWDGGRWVGPTGSRTEAAHQRGGRVLRQKMVSIDESNRLVAKARSRDAAASMAGSSEAARNVGRISGAGCKGTASNGLWRVAELARRVRSLGHLPLDRIAVVHGLVEDLAPIEGARVFFDPPYKGCARYAAVCSRASVIDVARRWATVAERVLLTEGEPLPLAGWDTWSLAPREWVTARGCTAHPSGVQLALWTAPERARPRRGPAARARNENLGDTP